MYGLRQRACKLRITGIKDELKHIDKELKNISPELKKVYFLHAPSFLYIDLDVIRLEMYLLTSKAKLQRYPLPSTKLKMKFLLNFAARLE